MQEALLLETGPPLSPILKPCKKKACPADLHVGENIYCYSRSVNIKGWLMTDFASAMAVVAGYLAFVLVGRIVMSQMGSSDLYPVQFVYNLVQVSKIRNRGNEALPFNSFFVQAHLYLQSSTECKVPICHKLKRPHFHRMETKRYV